MTRGVCVCASKSRLSMCALLGSASSPSVHVLGSAFATLASYHGVGAATDHPCALLSSTTSGAPTHTLTLGPHPRAHPGSATSAADAPVMLFVPTAGQLALLADTCSKLL